MNRAFCNPPFQVTRASHVCLTTGDIEASRAFYEDIAGLKVSHREPDAVYMRGVEEVCHHSLILRRSDEPPSCDAIGFRVLQDADLDAAEAYFRGIGESIEWIDRRGQGRTLLVRHSSKVVFELVAEMETLARGHTEYQAPRGGRALRLDHVQIVVPDVGATGDKFVDMGFRASEAIVESGTQRCIGLFLHRKNNPHDLVLAMGAGPRLHHFAYVVSDLQSVFRACDVAGSMGIGNDVERGPGRHGPGNGTFVYFRDPMGHRLELILPPMQYMDQEEETRIWTASEKHMIVPWGGPAPQRWREEATVFTGVPLSGDSLARWTSR
ncbi:MULTISPECIES: VOC family protein [unclassified Sinorhizobium]|uniref:VOC family protein n=1 Tax=unclassified Sinorhizobium TaxID=2613772 RepID=UPI0035237106